MVTAADATSSQGQPTGQTPQASQTAATKAASPTSAVDLTAIPQQLEAAYDRLDTDAARLPTPRVDCKRISAARLAPVKDDGYASSDRPRLCLHNLACGLIFAKLCEIALRCPLSPISMRRSARFHRDFTEIALGFSGLRNFRGNLPTFGKLPLTFLIWKPITLDTHIRTRICAYLCVFARICAYPMCIMEYGIYNVLSTIRSVSVA